MTENGNMNVGVSQEPSQPAASVSAATPVEKMLPQSQVNDLVGHAKRESYDKGKQDALAEWQKQPHASPLTVNTGQQTLGGMPQLSQADVEKIAAEQVQQRFNIQQQEAERQYWHQQAVQVESQIRAKLNDAKSHYADFDEVVTPEALASIPEVLILANSTDNGGHVVYDLLKNPGKLLSLNGAIDRARVTNSPYFKALAEKQIRDAAQSIRANQEALANQPHIKEPLSQVKPSTAGMDNGTKTVSDLRKQDWLRA